MMGVRHSSQIMVDIIKWVNRLSPLKQIFDSETLTLSRRACLEQCFSTLLLEAHKKHFQSLNQTNDIKVDFDSIYRLIG